MNFSLRNFACIGAVLFVAWIAFRLHFPLSTTAFLFFPIIVVAALKFGFWQATATSLVSVAILDYYFTLPLFSFRMFDPADWIALGAFEFGALVVSRLSADALDHTRIADRERNRTEKLYQLARSILLLDVHEPAGPQIAAFVHQSIGADSVALFDSAAARVHAAGTPDSQLENLVRNVWVQDDGMDDRTLHTWSRVLRLGTESIGAIALRGSSPNALIMDAVASTAAAALDRAHSFEKEHRAEAARQADQLRTAVLDALAHAFKTPLTGILAASSGLLDAGSLGPREEELLLLIDREATRLIDLTTRLLQTARLDSRAIRVSDQGYTVSNLIDTVMEAFTEHFETRPVRLVLPDRQATGSGDRDLIATALRQLVDNAFKYSTPGSPVTIGASADEKETVLSVHNEGTVILPEHRERIFERFYRVPRTEHGAAGTGLGLSIVKKVAEAHNGRTWVVSNPAAGTTFFMLIPRITGKTQ